MKVLNVHERLIAASLEAVGALIDALGSRADQMWPADRWPAMRLDRSVSVGASGGHGPIRYVVEAHEPGRLVRFRFSSPPGFEGSHGFAAEALGAGKTRLRHAISMRVHGPALITWPFIFRPLHNALIEDALEQAERALGGTPSPVEWSFYVRALRWTLRRIQRRKRRSAGQEPTHQRFSV